MIKFEHSVFALPFALTGALLGFRDGGYQSAGIGGKRARGRGGLSGGRLSPVSALPFALTGALLGSRDGRNQSAGIGGKRAWIVVPRIGASFPPIPAD